MRQLRLYPLISVFSFADYLHAEGCVTLLRRAGEMARLGLQLSLYATVLRRRKQGYRAFYHRSTTMYG